MIGSKLNQYGIAHLVPIAAAVVLLVGGTGYMVMQKRSNEAHERKQDSAQLEAKQKLAINDSDVEKVTVPKQEATAQTAHETKPAPAPQAKPAPKPATKMTPAPQGTISFSSDGCMVTATAKAGYKVQVGAYSDKKGGSSEHVLPDSGTITVSAGGIKGMTSYGKIWATDGTKIAYGSATITLDSCPAS